MYRAQSKASFCSKDRQGTLTSGKWAFRPTPLVPNVFGPGLMDRLVPVQTATDAARVRHPLVPVRGGPLVPVGNTNRD